MGRRAGVLVELLEVSRAGRGDQRVLALLGAANHARVVNLSSELGSPRLMNEAARHRRLLRPQLPPEPVEGDRRSAKAREVNREIARHIDVMIGNEEDFTASLGFEVEGVDENLAALQVDKFAAMIAKAAAAYPNFQVIATTMRTASGWRSSTAWAVATHSRPD